MLIAVKPNMRGRNKAANPALSVGLEPPRSVFYM